MDVVRHWFPDAEDGPGQGGSPSSGQAQLAAEEREFESWVDTLDDEDDDEFELEFEDEPEPVYAEPEYAEQPLYYSPDNPYAGVDDARAQAFEEARAYIHTRIDQELPSPAALADQMSDWRERRDGLRAQDEAIKAAESQQLLWDLAATSRDRVPDEDIGRIAETIPFAVQEGVRQAVEQGVPLETILENLQANGEGVLRAAAADAAKLVADRQLTDRMMKRV